MKLFITLGWLAIGCSLAQARIGETKKECEERYGKPAETRERGSVHLYTKEGLILLVFFHEEKAGYIMYSKAERNALGKAEEFSEDEREVLLKANGGNREWKVLGRDRATIVLETKDSALRAQYDTVDHGLLIFTPEGVKQRQNSQKAEAEKRLRGF